MAVKAAVLAAHPDCLTYSDFKKLHADCYMTFTQFCKMASDAGLEMDQYTPEDKISQDGRTRRRKKELRISDRKNRKLCLDWSDPEQVAAYRREARARRKQRPAKS